MLFEKCRAARALTFVLFCCVLSSQIFAQGQQPTLVNWDFSTNKSVLQAAPMQAPGTLGLAFQVPLLDGQMHMARVVASPIFKSDVAAQFPDIQSYEIWNAAGEPYFSGRLNVTAQGFFGVLRTENGLVFIEPNGSEQQYRIERKRLSRPEDFKCGAIDWENEGEQRAGNRAAMSSASNGATRRAYAMAIVMTDEYEAANQPNPATVATNNITVANVLYESELAIHFDIAGIAAESATYNINTAGGANADEAIVAVNAYFPNQASYDIGHVFHNPGGSGGAGVAYLAAVCRNVAPFVGGPTPLKAGGWSGASDNTAGFWYGILLHEMAHMFGAHHTFNGTQGNCGGGGQINAGTSVEPGSGTTLMSYSGSCGTDNIIVPGGSSTTTDADADDEHFHSVSLDEMISYISTGSGSTCSSNTATGNAVPVANANPGGQAGITIPKQTPFTLIGSASDADNDPLTYSWEQENPGPPHGAPAVNANNASGPIFRVYEPVASPARTFPALTYILNNANVVPNANYGEVLPGVARSLNFNFLVRDNHASNGGMASSPLTVTVSANGPLQVSAPNTAVSWAAGSAQNVTWTVNGTNAIPTCANVNILMSVNGGISFPYVLASNTPNDGSQSITVPANCPATTQARIRVECNTGNQYIVPFDLSNTNFTITSADCVAATNNICPANAVTFAAGAAGLNLGLSGHYGTAFASNAFTMAAADPNITIPGWNSTSTACASTGFNNDYKTLPFVVSQTGTYNIGVTGSASFSGFVIYTAANFSQAAPCNGFVTSNYRVNANNTVTIFSGATVTLNACTPYLILATNLNAVSPFTTTVSFSGPGEVYQSLASPGASYGYTYIAQNTVSGTVAAVSATSNFTSLGAGTYCIYGVSYKTSGTGSVDPATFVGQTLSQVLASCAQLSSNCKSVTVTGGGCTPPTINTQPASQTVCAGTNVTFSVAATTGTGVLTYQWRKNGADIGGATASSYSINNATAGDAGTYMVVVSNAANCSTNSNNATLTVNALPTAAITGDLNICTGEMTTLTASGGGSYAWSSGAATAAINVSPANTTPYTVTVTNAAGCTDTETATVTVNGLPTAAIAGNLTLCNGKNTTLTASGGGNYAWSTGAATAAITVSPTATTAYTVTVTNAAGCTDTETATVTVNPTPTASISGDLSICNGESTTLTASGGGTYAWSTGAATAAITVTPTATTAYTVTVTNGFGCTDTETASVTVTAGLNVTFTPTKPTCFGSSNGKLKANPSGGTAPYTYAWSNGGNTQTILNIPAGVYTVTVTSANGCSRVATYTLTQPTAVVANGVVTNITCNGLANGQIVGSATGGTGTKTFLWSTGAATATITGLAAGTYTLTATDTKGCTGTKVFTVVEPSALGLNVVSIVAATGGKWKVTLLGNGGTIYSVSAPYRYNHRPNGSATWTLLTWGSTRIFTLNPGSYDFGVRDKNLCETVLTNVPVPPPFRPANNADALLQGFPAALRAFPNPTNGTFFLQMQNLPAGEVSIEIFDLQGRLVHARQIADGASEASATFDLSSETPGLYFVKVKSGDLVESLRVFKE